VVNASVMNMEVGQYLTKVLLKNET